MLIHAMRSCGCTLTLLCALPQKNNSKDIFTVQSAIKVWIWNNHRLAPTCEVTLKAVEFLVSEAWLADRGPWVDLWKLSLTLDPPRFPLFLALLQEVSLFSMIPSMTWNLSEIRSQNKYFCPQVLCVRCFSQWKEMYLKCMPARIES